MRSSVYYGGSATALVKKGAAASYRVNANTGYLVTTACPTCGPVDVYLGTRLLGRLQLKAAGTRHRVLVRLPGSGPLTGLLTFRRVKPRTTVIIDGLVLKAR